MKNRDKPNILIIQTDSHDGRAAGFMGHPALHHATPNIDRLAANGVVFEDFHCNYPLCCPSRASTWSGRYPHNIGAWNNYCGLAPDDDTFATALAKEGYHVGVFGKTDYLSGAHSLPSRLASWSRAAAIPRPVHGEKNPPKVFNEDKERVRSGDWQTVDDGVRWLKEAAVEENPFLLYLGIKSPHPGFSTSARYLEKIPEDKVSLPPVDALEHPLLPLQELQKNWRHALDEEGMLLRRRVYFAMIAEIDAMVGKVMDALEASGQSGNTWVIFTSDHGEMAGEHGQYIKLTHFEASSRVPLIVSGPDAQAGRRIKTVASLVDLYPTLLELGGASLPNDCDGHSLANEVRGLPTSRAGYAFAEYHATTCPTGSFMLREGDWKYIAYPGYPSMLFNLREDPDELHNVCDENPEVSGAMEKRLREIVDYEAVDSQAKEEDRKQFSAWREDALREGTYEEQMVAVYSGAGHPPGPVQPWRDEDEERIRQWLAGETPSLPEISEEGDV